MSKPSLFVSSVLAIWLALGQQLCLGASNSPEEFFSLPDTIAAKLSPDGDTAALLKANEGGQELVLVKIGTGRSSTILNTEQHADNNSAIKEFVWLDSQYLAVQLYEITEGVEDLLDTRLTHRLLILDTEFEINSSPTLYSVRTTGWLAHPLRQEAGHFLYAKSGIVSTIYKLNVSLLAPEGKRLGKLDKKDGGQFSKSNEISSIPGYAIRWFFDHKGEADAALAVDRSGNLNLSEADESGAMQVIYTWEKEGESTNASSDSAKRLIPVAIADTPHTYYCLDANEERRRSVYKVNFKEYREELVHQTHAYKISDLIVSDDHQLLGVKVVRDGGLVHEYLDKTQFLLKHKNKADNHVAVSYDESLDGKHSILFEQSHNSPSRFSYIHGPTGKKVLLGELYPQLPTKLGSTLVESSVEVGGLKIPYLLTLPTHAKQPYPIIVMPHGGPIGVFDTRLYDAPTQFFSANGYAVLRVNFRGSGGHSRELEEAGKREWGDLMLRDIMQATKQVSSRTDIDSNNVCALGMSYGGYAAVMLSIQHPDMFKCAASVAGVLDVVLHLQYSEHTDQQRQWLREYVGDVEKEFDYLKSISPVYLAPRVQQPLFIAHGEKDDVVDIEHAYRMKLMLEKYGKEYVWHIDENGSHRFGEAQQTIELFARLLSFLKANTNHQQEASVTSY